MFNNVNIRQNVVAALAALAVSSTVIFGTVGPVQADNSIAQSQLVASHMLNETPSVLIA